MNACLGPNESGFFYGAITNDVFAMIASNEFAVFTSVQDGALPVPFTKANDNFLAESNSVDMSRPQNVTITIRNKGSETGRVGISNYYVILDDLGDPIEVNDASIANDVLVANQTALLTDTTYFDGTSSSIIVYVSHASLNNLTPSGVFCASYVNSTRSAEDLAAKLNQDYQYTLVLQQQISNELLGQQ